MPVSGLFHGNAPSSTTARLLVSLVRTSLDELLSQRSDELQERAMGSRMSRRDSERLSKSLVIASLSACTLPTLRTCKLRTKPRMKAIDRRRQSGILALRLNRGGFNCRLCHLLGLGAEAENTSFASLRLEPCDTVLNIICLPRSSSAGLKMIPQEHSSDLRVKLDLRPSCAPVRY